MKRFVEGVDRNQATWRNCGGRSPRALEVG